MRGKKKHVTSSYFKDIKTLISSEIDTNYRKLYRERKNSDFDISKLQLAYAVQKLSLFHKGCEELTDYLMKLSNKEIENVVPDYPGIPYEEYTEDIPRDKWFKSDGSEKPIYKTSGDL
jgi:hypothetical protein